MSYGQTYANDLFAIDAAESERAAFMRRTYLHLFGAILGFIGLEAIIFSLFTPAQILGTVLANGNVGIIVISLAFIGAASVAQWWAHSPASPAMQYMGLSLYTVIQAICLAPWLALATWIDQRTGGNIIATSGVITLLMFGGLTTIVLASGADFSFLRTGLWIGAWSLLVIAITGAVMGFTLGLVFAVAGLLVASGFILYDTSNVLHHYRTDQHVGAALELFASVAMLFYYVLRIVIALQSRD